MKKYKKSQGFKPCSSCKTKAACKKAGRCLGGMKEKRQRY